MKKEEKESIRFKPHRGYIAIALPAEAYPVENLEFTSKAAWMAIVDEKGKEYVNGELTVVAIGEGVDTVAVGDRIIAATHARLQRIEIEVGTKYPKLYWVMRESEILVIMV